MNAYYDWDMNELQILKKELLKKLDTINEALQIQAEWNQSGKNGDTKPISLDSDDIEKVILGMDGNFSAKEIPQAIRKQFKRKPDYKDSVIPTVLYKLVSDGKLEYVRERSGRKAAIYRRTHKWTKNPPCANTAGKIPFPKVGDCTLEDTQSL